jgi:hypothetical protein
MDFDYSGMSSFEKEASCGISNRQPLALMQAFWIEVGDVHE